MSVCGVTIIPDIPLVEKVDAFRKKRPGKILRNTWILEAIEDKVERESE